MQTGSIGGDGNALHTAAVNGSPEILALMIKAGAEINVALKRAIGGSTSYSEWSLPTSIMAT